MGSHNFEVYRTSAGAGKTYTIVKEFIQLNLSGKSRFDTLAAITFTNKAANEMKDRITEYLYAIANKHTHRKEIVSLIDELKKDTGKNEDEIIAGCANILHDILHNYSRFSISTIDSFIHDILRIFSHDLKLPENFNVEIDTKMLSNTIVNELLFGLEQSPENSTAEKISNYVIDLALNRFEEKDNWDITQELNTFAEFMFSEDGMNHIPNLAKYSTEDFSGATGRLLNLQKKITEHIQAKGKEAMDAISAENLSIDDFYQKKRGIWNYFNTASNASFNTEIKANSYVMTTLEQDKWESAGSNISEALRSKLRHLFCEIDENPLVQHIQLIYHIRTQTGPMALLGRMQQLLDEYQKENQVLPISLFNKLIADIVRNEPAPFIYERLGQKYRHFLLDEFQDTSVMQWQNFLPLIDNALAQNNHALIVGDVKQSIYRFRNGEMEQLMSLPLIYNKPDSSSHFDDIEYSLNACFQDRSQLPEFTNTNYRSGQHIVELNNMHFIFINDVYTQLQDNPYIPVAYADAAQNFPESAKNKGEVCFYPLEDTEYRKQTLDAILQIIRSSPKMSDIAILTRGNNSAKEIAGFLMQQNPPIPVISSESLELGFSHSVNFIMDMLRLIDNPENHIALAGAFTFLHKFKSSENKTIFNNSNWLNDTCISLDGANRTHAFLALLNTAGYVIDFQELCMFQTNQIVSELIRVFKLADPPDAYVLFFQNKLGDFLIQNNGGITDVLKWWTEKGSSTSIIVPEGTEAVRIFTVHKSKGLQFPVVIYPFADFRLKNNNAYIWVPISLFPEEIKQSINMPGVDYWLMKLSMHKLLPDEELKRYVEKEIHKQELDSLNIHYVAMTRAKHSLHVLYKNKELKENNTPGLINELIAQFIEAKHDLFSENTDSGFRQLTYGTPYEGEKTKEIEENPELEYYFIRPRGSVSAGVVSRYRSQAGKTGEMFHEFMAETHHREVPAEQFEQFCSKRKIQDEQKQKLGNLLNQILSHPETSFLFSPDLKHYNETDIIDGENVYRPDKILSGSEETIIVDFKTGKKYNKHTEQIGNYCRLLEKMGFVNVTSRLVYVSENEIEVIRVS